MLRPDRAVDQALEKRLRVLSSRAESPDGSGRPISRHSAERRPADGPTRLARGFSDHGLCCENPGTRTRTVAPHRWERILDPDATVANGEDFAAIHPLAPDARLYIESIQTPAHVLSGMADLIVEDLRQAVPLAKTLPNARHSRFEGVGHMLHHSRPDAVLNAVREGLRSSLRIEA